MLNIAWANPKEAEDLIVALFSSPLTAGHVPLLHGPPGVGKSTIARNVAQRLGAQIIDLRLCQLEPSDIRGQSFADPRSMQTVHARPTFLPPASDSQEAEYILFLDELLAAHDVVRKAAFELILDKRVGPHKLGPNVRIMAAGNTLEDGTNIFELDSATADRFLHIGIANSVETFLAYAMRKGLHPDVIAFLRSHPMLFEASDKDRREGLVALPSPRSFERWSEILFSGLQGRALEIALKGWCGEQVGSLFLTALKEKEEQFDLFQIVSAKRSERVYPKTQFAQLALGHNLMAWAKTPEQLRTAIEIMIDMPNDSPGALESKTFFINALPEHPAMTPSEFIQLASSPEVRQFLDARNKAFEES